MPHRGDVTTGPERGPSQPQEAGDSQGDDGTYYVPRPQQVQRGDGDQRGLAHQIGPALSAPDTTGQHEQPQPAKCGQGPRGLRHSQGQELA